jgi:hypothetical protein
MASRPIPLGQLQGGGDGGGGWMMTLLVCCISSIISAIVGFVFRKQITGALGKTGGASADDGAGAGADDGAGAVMGAGVAPAAAARGRAAVKARRLKIKGGWKIPKMFGRRKGGRKARKKFGGRKAVKGIPGKFGRRKGVRKIRGKLGRSLKKFGRRKAVKGIRGKLGRSLKKFGRRKAVKKFGRRKAVKKIGGRVGKMFRRRCFDPETLIKLQDGNEVAMKDLKLGDVLINGSIVNGVMNILNETNPYYKIHSSELDRDIYVTGSHYIKDGNVYKAVKNFSGAEVTTKIDREVSCLITSDHKIPVGGYIFWDWEDDKIQQ